jgi:cell division protein FtsZ
MVAIRMDETMVANKAKIVVIGAGGGGGNAVNNMVSAGLEGVHFVAANTDRQALDASKADHVVQLGTRLTRGLGAGANPTKGREAALEDKMMLSEMVKEYDMVFVTAGMGGGTGTGAAPVIAEAAREAGALTVGVVTKPFLFEGGPRMRNADSGIAELAKHVDSLVVIPNDRLLETCNEPMGLLDAFGMADNVLRDAVKSISDLIVLPGLINVDFADAKRIMTQRGKAIMGMGEGSGEGRAAQAAQRAMTSSLLEETSIDGATGVLVNITGGPDLKIQEVNEAMRLINGAADEAAEIIMGCVIDPSLTDRIKITVIATGFDVDKEYGRELEAEMMAGMQQDTAAPGSHWNQRSRPTGMLGRNPQQEMAQANANRNMLGRDRCPARAQSQMTPPPMPPRAETVTVQQTASRPVAESPMMQRDADFDPSKPNDWF